MKISTNITKNVSNKQRKIIMNSFYISRACDFNKLLKLETDITWNYFQIAIVHRRHFSHSYACRGWLNWESRTGSRVWCIFYNTCESSSNSFHLTLLTLTRCDRLWAWFFSNLPISIATCDKRMVTRNK